MAHEQTLPPWKRPSPVPVGYDWASLVKLDGPELEAHCRAVLAHLGAQQSYALRTGLVRGLRHDRPARDGEE